MTDVVDQIVNLTIPKGPKIIRLYAVTQVFYRQPLGDKAWGAMRELTDADTTTAIAFIGGLMSGNPKKEKLMELIALPV